MVEVRNERRLSAILAADIVGYSRLMGADEAGTLEALLRLRAEVFEPEVAVGRGKIIKSMGDGWLVSFPSVAEAVACAFQVQDKLADHQTIKLRIGLHTGDVVFRGDDIFGDGVNVAARLQEFAQAGAVALSDAAFGSLDGALAPSFDDVGWQDFKNIALKEMPPNCAAPSRMCCVGRRFRPKWCAIADLAIRGWETLNLHWIAFDRVRSLWRSIHTPYRSLAGRRLPALWQGMMMQRLPMPKGGLNRLMDTWHCIPALLQPMGTRGIPKPPRKLLPGC